ncbi:UNVERIFIED_CONTAM: hypothetical protein K2H54_010805 [Gekko kuhli]
MKTSPLPLRETKTNKLELIWVTTQLLLQAADVLLSYERMICICTEDVPKFTSTRKLHLCLAMGVVRMMHPCNFTWLSHGTVDFLGKYYKPALRGYTLIVSSPTHAPHGPPTDLENVVT